MKTFVTSDPHFGHKNMTREGTDLCGRPFDTVDEMNEALLDGINSVVGKEDRLIMLGDLCMGKLELTLPLLELIQAAEIILLPGNHDRWSLAYHAKGDAAAQAARREKARSMYERDSRFVVFRDEKPSVWAGKELFETSGPLSDALFSHYPYSGDSHSDEDRYGFLRAEDYGRPIIHGHVHTEWRTRGRQFNVGVDVNNFKPVSAVELADWVKGLK